MNKIIYISNVRLPTEKAHGIQIVEMCSAFVQAGCDVELVVSNRNTPIGESIHSYYGLPNNFTVTKIPCVDLVRWGKAGFVVQAITFTLSAFFYSLTRKDFIYTREVYVAAILSILNKFVIWETHDGRNNFFVKRILRLGIPIVAITQGLKDYYCKLGATEARVLVAPDAVDIEKFSTVITKSEACQKISQHDVMRVLYTGHLYPWKGAHILAEAAELLPGEVEVMFVGGTKKDITEFSQTFGSTPNILIVEKKHHSEMPIYMRSADVLVLPNSAKEDISRLYTSPMKLFEYMASGRPIVASDLPSLRQVLSEENSILVEPDNPHDLAKGIMRLLESPKLGKELAERSLVEVKNYTWEKRADSILDFAKGFLLLKKSN